MVLVCHVIYEGHVAKGANIFMGRTRLRYVRILSSLVAISTVLLQI